MRIVLIGAGGHGKVALEALRDVRSGRARKRAYTVTGFLDADATLSGSIVAGVPVLGGIDLLPRLARARRVGGAFVAIGDNRTRLHYMHVVRQAGIPLISAVHPAAVVSASATVGDNVLVAAGATVSAESVLCDGAIVNTGAVVDHECVVAEGAHVCPAAALAGRVRVGEGAFLGLGCRVIQCLTVGAWATVGAGAVVLQDVPEAATVVGVPAKRIDRPGRK